MASIIKVDQIQESTIGNGTNFSSSGSASTPTISIGNQTNKGFYHEGTNKIGVSVGGSKVGEIGVGYGGFTGNIIQVQSTTKSDTFTTTSTSFIVPGLNVNITPRFITSKILVMMGISYICDAGSYTFFARVLRDSTSIGIGDIDPVYTSRTRATVGGQRTTDPAHPLTQTIQFLDSPSLVSTLNYQVQVISQGGTISINRSGSGETANDSSRGTTISNITVMEIQQ